jgi:hypothetical protein
MKRSKGANQNHDEGRGGKNSRQKEFKKEFS